jgi:hypothetical protein
MPQRLLLTLALLSLATIVGCGADHVRPPESGAVNAPLRVARRPLEAARLSAHLSAELGFTSRGGTMECAYLPLGQGPVHPTSNPPRSTAAEVFLETLCLEFVRQGDSLVEGSGRGGPVVVTVLAGRNELRLDSVVVPPDGGGYAAGVRRLFPSSIAERILERDPQEHNARVAALAARLRADAATRLGIRTSAPALRP